MTKPKGRRVRQETEEKNCEPLGEAAKRYEDSCVRLANFKEKHLHIMTQWQVLIDDSTMSKKSLETLALERSSENKKGRHMMYEDEHIRVRHKVSFRRNVDAGKLLKKYPDISEWKGLFTVVLGKLDAAVEAGQVHSEDLTEFTSQKQINSVEIEVI